MAKLWALFGNCTNYDQNTPGEDTIKTSRVLLGDLKRCQPCSRRLFELGLPQNAPTSNIYFPPLHPPVSLDRVRFEGQTFPLWKIQRDFQKLSFKQRRRLKQRKIYILPIGPFPEFVNDRIPGLKYSLFELLCVFVSKFYLGFGVTVMDVVHLDKLCCKTRIHGGTGKMQILVGDVLDYLRQSLPKDGVLIVGITWEDMYPGDEWNFVLGEASCVFGSAAMSFGHFEPKKSQQMYTGTGNIANIDELSRTDDQINREGREKNEEKNIACAEMGTRQCNVDSISDEEYSRTDDQNGKERMRKMKCQLINDAPGSGESAKIAKTNDHCMNSICEKEHYRTDDQTCKNNKSNICCDIYLECRIAKTHEFVQVEEKSIGPESVIRNYDEKHSRTNDHSSHSTKSISDISAISSSGKDLELHYELENTDRIDKIDAFQIWKFFRVVTHELGHVFGLTHCFYFSCAMNESSTIQEAIGQPLFMCPICLKKIQAAAGFDVVERYQDLKGFLEMVVSGLLGIKYEDCDEFEASVDCDHVKTFSSAIDWLKLVLTFLEKD